ncbi:MAG: MEDS domain-containing protein [Candidatus Zixiibacteriota bacterium]
MKTNTKKKQVTKMDGKIRKTGIDIMGDVPWGTHFCQFYQTKEDLIDILVPYFKAGLENNEFCMWVTSEPLDEEEAKKAMRKVVPDFDRYLKRGQIEIVPHTQQYLKDGAFNLQRVLNAWIDKLNFALAEGYDGIRVTGNTAWLEKRDWRNFASYEEEVNNVIGKYKMMAICTYSLDRCGASEIIDVVKNHQFALIRREGNWELIESSEHKQKVAELERVAKEWQQTFDAIPDIVALISPDFEFIRLNRRGYESLGKKPEEVIGKRCYEIVHGLDAPIDGCPCMKMIRTHKAGVSELTIGGRHYIATASPVLNKNSELIAFAHTIQDITDRKRMERAFQEAREYAEGIVATIREPLLVLDADLRVVSANRSFYQTFKVTPQDTEGQFLCDLGNRQWDIPELRKLLEDILLKNITLKDFEVEHDFLNIGRRIMLLNAREVHREKTEAQMILLTIQDITERKRAEEEIKKKNKELEAFVHIVSHDLKNPVVSIQGFCSLLMKNHKEDLHEKALFYIERVQANANLMTSLLEDLIELSRIGRIEDKKKEISVKELIESVWHGVQRSLPLEGVQLMSPQSFPRVFYSEKRLYQIFYNLLSNAVKFRGENKTPKVKIGYQDNEEDYTFFVQDNGIGIKQEYHNKIFDFFSRLEDTKSEGTGLGLSIVKKIVEANGGKVWVESQRKAGSTFYFTIPKKCGSSSF